MSREARQIRLAVLVDAAAGQTVDEVLLLVRQAAQSSARLRDLEVRAAGQGRVLPWRGCCITPHAALAPLFACLLPCALASTLLAR